mmetsp:Transcript_25127/g.58560  ORF Transcript_25127/g.58560 Transcript_25127/m.58560 type:complete len:217 (-) Transcript_25127:245-895(-)
MRDQRQVHRLRVRRVLVRPSRLQALPPTDGPRYSLHPRRRLHLYGEADAPAAGRAAAHGYLVHYNHKHKCARKRCGAARHRRAARTSSGGRLYAAIQWLSQRRRFLSNARRRGSTASACSTHGRRGVLDNTEVLVLRVCGARRRSGLPHVPRFPQRRFAREEPGRRHYGRRRHHMRELRRREPEERLIRLCQRRERVVQGRQGGGCRVRRLGAARR